MTLNHRSKTGSPCRQTTTGHWLKPRTVAWGMIETGKCSIVHRSLVASVPTKGKFWNWKNSFWWISRSTMLIKIWRRCVGRTMGAPGARGPTVGSVSLPLVSHGVIRNKRRDSRIMWNRRSFIQNSRKKRPQGPHHQGKSLPESNYSNSMLK